MTPARATIGLALTRVLVAGWLVPRFALRTLRQVLRRPREAWGRGIRGLKEFGRQAGRRSGQFAVEGRFLSDSISDLVRNLCALGARGADGGPVTVLVEGRSTLALLHLLRLLKIVPLIRLLGVRRVAQVGAIVRDLDSGAGRARLILSRGLYWRCYHALQGSGARQAITVI